MWCSLGMVGALSIVRFRTAITEPLDIAFLFWAIAAGIVLAAGMIPLAVIGSVVIRVMLLVFVNRKPHQNPYLAVITCEDDHAEQMARDFLAATVEKSVVKSKAVTRDQIELNYEIPPEGQRYLLCQRAYRNQRRHQCGARQLQWGVYGVNGASLGQRIPGQLKHTKDRWPKKGGRLQLCPKASASISSVW